MFESEREIVKTEIALLKNGEKQSYACICCLFSLFCFVLCIFILLLVGVMPAVFFLVIFKGKYI